MAVFALVHTGGAEAQVAHPPAPPPAVSTTPSTPVASEEQDIVIVADASDRSSIDRKTYVIKDNAEARSSNVLDLLSHVPFVDVTSGGRVRLMGDPGVKILIDGKETADPATTLRNLQGSQVLKIEVVGNPSAAFSAQGTAGIINIITRRSFTSGLGGSITANTGSFASSGLRISPTWTRGALTLSGGFNLTHSITPIEYQRDRRDFNDGGVAESLEEGRIRSWADILSSNMLVSYKLSPKQTLSLGVTVLDANQGSSSRSSFSFPDDLGDQRRQTSKGKIDLDAQEISLDYQREGSRNGETLTVSGQWSRRDLRMANAFAIVDSEDGVSDFAIVSNSLYSAATLKVDYVLPFGTKRRLSFGGAIQHIRNDILLEAATTPSVEQGGPLAERSMVRGSWFEPAAYVTYQTPFLGGTLLAGLRVEGRRYTFRDTPTLDRPVRSSLFPSLHIERKLGKRLSANLSYSRRVAWPGISDLNPALRFSDPTTASAGNPSLRPEYTDSYEAALELSLSKHSIALTGFSRTTRDTWSDNTDFDDDGAFVKSPINLGTRTKRGASVSLKGPIARGLSYTINAYLAGQSYRLGRTGVDFTGTGADYGASTEIVYRDGVDGRRGADRITLSARYYGPAIAILYRTSSTLSADVSWSHALSDRLSGVLRISDVLGPPKTRTTNYSTYSIAKETNFVPGPRIMFSLTYSLRPPGPR